MEINIDNFLKNISKKYNDIIFDTEFNNQTKTLTIEYERYFILYSLDILRKETKTNELTKGFIEYFLEKMEKFESLDDRSCEENGILMQFEECSFELKKINNEFVLTEEDQKEIIHLFKNLEEDKKSALEQEQKNISDIEKMKNKLEELKRTE